MKNKQILRIFILSVLFFSFFYCSVRSSPNTHAASNLRPELNILIDASGSMGKQVEGKSKMIIAKEAISTLINSLPAETRVGLRTYGSQYPESAKNCTDTKLLVPISTLNKSEIEKQMAPLTPSGWTPIEYSLRQAYNDFSASAETPRYIVLVSDGEETCGGDPCAAARDLESKGIEVTINTIGFTVDQATKDQLACIAQATGGSYYDANNTQELNNSLSEATKPVREFIAYTTEGEEIVGGSGFETATQIYLDKQYLLDILNEETLFFFLNVPQNQKLTEFSATVKAPSNCHVGVDINTYGENRKNLYLKGSATPVKNTVGVINLAVDKLYTDYDAYFGEPHNGLYLTLHAMTVPKGCSGPIRITLKTGSEPFTLLSPTEEARKEYVPKTSTFPLAGQSSTRLKTAIVLVIVIIVIIIVGLVLLFKLLKKKSSVDQTQN